MLRRTPEGRWESVGPDAIQVGDVCWSPAFAALFGLDTTGPPFDSPLPIFQGETMTANESTFDRRVGPDSDTELDPGFWIVPVLTRPRTWVLRDPAMPCRTRVFYEGAGSYPLTLRSRNTTIAVLGPIQAGAIIGADLMFFNGQWSITFQYPC